MRGRGPLGGTLVRDWLVCDESRAGGLPTSCGVSLWAALVRAGGQCGPRWWVLKWSQLGGLWVLTTFSAKKATGGKQTRQIDRGAGFGAWSATFCPLGCVREGREGSVCEVREVREVGPSPALADLKELKKE